MSDNDTAYFSAMAESYRAAYVEEEARRCEAEAQLAEALSQLQAALEEAERLRGERGIIPFTHNGEVRYDSFKCYLASIC